MRESSITHSTVPGAKWLVTANRLAGSALVVLGLVILGVGFFLGLFAWMNNGVAAGLELTVVTAGFALAFVVTGFSFRVIARAHAARSARRWWLQVLLPLAAAWIAFGLAAEFSSIAGNLVR
jgi:hypothetical protein